MNKLHVLARVAFAAAILTNVSAVCPQRALAQAGQPAPGVASQLPPPPQIMSENDPRNPLHLTTAQQKQALVINQTFMSGLGALQADKTMTVDQKKAKFLQIQATAIQQFTTLLTPSQKVVFDQKRAQQQAYMKGSQDAQAKFVELQKQFLASLSPAQQTKINALKQSGVKQLAAINQNKALSDMDKGKQEQAVRVAIQAKIKSILSPKQSQMVDDAYRSLSNATTLEHLAQETGN